MGLQKLQRMLRNQKITLHLQFGHFSKILNCNSNLGFFCQKRLGSIPQKLLEFSFFHRTSKIFQQSSQNF